MKSLKELDQIKEEVKKSQQEAKEGNNIKITIGMGTCGIAAGAKDVADAMMDEIEARGLDNVTLSRSGCIGLCEHEPLLKIETEDQPTILYGDLTPNLARKVVSQHIVNGQIVDSLVINLK